MPEEENVQDSEGARLSGKRYRSLNEWHGTGIQCWLKKRGGEKNACEIWCNGRGCKLTMERYRPSMHTCLVWTLDMGNAHGGSGGRRRTR